MKIMDRRTGLVGSKLVTETDPKAREIRFRGWLESQLAARVT